MMRPSIGMVATCWDNINMLLSVYDKLYTVSYTSRNVLVAELSRYFCLAAGDIAVCTSEGFHEMLSVRGASVKAVASSLHAVIY